jgi:hypothetical protein
MTYRNRSSAITNDLPHHVRFDAPPAKILFCSGSEIDVWNLFAGTLLVRNNSDIGFALAKNSHHLALHGKLGMTGEMAADLTHGYNFHARQFAVPAVLRKQKKR